MARLTQLAPEFADRLLNRYLDKVLRQCRDKVSAFPHVSEGSRWLTTPDGDWTGGFWVGQLWLLWKRTRGDQCRQQAERFLTPLTTRKDAARVDFDLGFLYGYSFALGYDLTGVPSYRDTALQAADRLLTLCHSSNGIIYHLYPDRIERYGSGVASSIVDVMMDLNLLWWAHRRTGEKAYLSAAQSHTVRTLEWLVRDDGSTAHLVDFDNATGFFLRHDTHQGYSAASCWSRGQAWAIYGFLEAYRNTADPRFLHTCRTLLGYWTDHVPDDGVPPWDFQAPESTRHTRDTSAAAITCAALAQAGRHEVDLGEGAGELYERTMNSLWEAYLANDEADGVLSGGCWHYPAGWGVNQATVWGDYYLLEAVVGR